MIRIGIDIMSANRMQLFHTRTGDRGLKRLFVASELKVLLSHNRYERLAARFAAKEAVMKAVGKKMDFRAIEICGDGREAPVALLDMDGRRITLPISMTHQDGVSAAVCVFSDDELQNPRRTAKRS